ncbi:MAG: hypothetical protein A2V66_02710 [Ignavibacteria bacterium RBG_13_36_8]|nr:MAG: hypothetical protein A2V66_02710 [Ignavibacteria bacterium RBG_13_36_8]
MQKKTPNKIHNEKFPQYCDFSCKYADFSAPEVVGACRKESAVWCKFFKKYNNKNNKCLKRT